MNRLSFAPLLLVAVATATAAEADVKVVGPEEAAKKADQQVVLRMEVKSAASRGGNYFLNSQENFRDAKNFTVFIPKEAVKKFKKAKVDNPADHFKGKTIQVTGKVVLFRGRPEIKVEGPEQIKVVEKK